jgi:hypothetical protein
MRSAIPHLYVSHATRAPTGANKIQCLQGKPALVEASKPLCHGEPEWPVTPIFKDKNRMHKDSCAPQELVAHISRQIT